MKPYLQGRVGVRVRVKVRVKNREKEWWVKVKGDDKVVGAREGSCERTRVKRPCTRTYERKGMKNPYLCIKVREGESEDEALPRYAPRPSTKRAAALFSS